MALAFLLLIMAFVRMLLFATDRGSRERMMFSLANTRETLRALYETTASQYSEDQLPFEFDDFVELLAPGGRKRIARSYGTRLVIAAVVCQVLTSFTPIPGWTLAPIPAVLIPLLPVIDAWLIGSLDRDRSPRKTRGQRAVEVATSLACIAFAWPAFHLCYAAEGSVVPRALVAYALLFASYLARRMGSRLAQRFASPQFERYATEDSVLYLRSFSDDRLSLYSPVTDGDLRTLLWPRISFEEFVGYCAWAAGCGNLITIGRPGEQLPLAGAMRSYFDDDTWQEAVRVTMLRCGTILLTMGSTESLGWEIRHVKKWGMIHKCFFLAPPLPEKEARARIERTLDALGISEDEKSREIPVTPEIVTGFRIMRDGSVQWQLCSGRDWGAYFFAISRATSAKSRSLRASTEAVPQDGGTSANPDSATEASASESSGSPLEQAVQETKARQHPLTPPVSVSRAAKASAEAGALFLTEDDYARAAELYDSHADELSRKPDASPEALMYLRVTGLRSQIRAKTGSGDELVARLKQLIRDSAQTSFVWISPTFKVLRGDEFRAWSYRLLAAAYGELRDWDGQRKAWERCSEESAHAGDVPGAIDAELGLASLGRDSAEMRRHAERALELASGISDAIRTAQSKEWLAHARSFEPSWSENLADVIDTLMDLGEPSLAAEACRRGLIDADRLSDDQAKRKLLELGASIPGDAGAAFRHQSTEAERASHPE